MLKRLLRRFRRRPLTHEEEEAHIEAQRLLEDNETVKLSRLGGQYAGRTWTDPKSGRR
jgi:hypothetical protein